MQPDKYTGCISYLAMIQHNVKRARAKHSENVEFYSTVYFTGFMILIMALIGCSSKASTTTIASQNSNKLNAQTDSVFSA